MLDSVRTSVFDEMISNIEKWKDQCSVVDEGMPHCGEEKAVMENVHKLQEQAILDFKNSPVSLVFSHLFQEVLPLLFHFFHEHVDDKKDFECLDSHRAQLLHSFNVLDDIVTIHRGFFVLTVVSRSAAITATCTEEQKKQIAQTAAKELENHPINKALDLLQDNIQLVRKNIDHYSCLKREIVHLENLNMMAEHAIDQVNMINMKIRQLENKRKKAKGKKKPKEQKQVQLEKYGESWEKSIEIIARKFDIVRFITKRDEIANSPKALQDSFDKTITCLGILFRE